MRSWWAHKTDAKKKNISKNHHATGGHSGHQIHHQACESFRTLGGKVCRVGQDRRAGRGRLAGRLYHPLGLAQAPMKP